MGGQIGPKRSGATPASRASRIRRRSASPAPSSSGRSRCTESLTASAASRTSSRASCSPKALTWRSTSLTAPSATGPAPAASRTISRSRWQLAGVAVGERAARVVAGHEQPLGDVVELGAHRLVAAPLPQPAGDRGHERAVAAQAGVERRPARAHLRVALREARAEPLDAVAQQPRGDAPVQVDGGRERGGRDAWVAVHVTAGPAREAQRRGVERLRAEAALELAHQLGHRVEQDAVDVVQVAPHLVVDLGALLAHLRGLPPEGERLADVVDDALLGSGAVPLVVELGQPLADVARVVHDRPAGGLRGVRGEGELQPQVVERAGGGLGGAGGELGGGLGERLPLRRPARALVAPAAADALARLGEVGQVELHRACADDVERAAREDLLDQRGGLGVVLAGARPSRGTAQAHDGGTQALAALAGDRLLEQLGEQLRVPIEGGGGRGSVGDRQGALKRGRRTAARGSSPRSVCVGPPVQPGSGSTPGRSRAARPRRGRRRASGGRS